MLEVKWVSGADSETGKSYFVIKMDAYNYGLTEGALQHSTTELAQKLGFQMTQRANELFSSTE